MIHRQVLAPNFQLAAQIPTGRPHYVFRDMHSVLRQRLLWIHYGRHLKWPMPMRAPAGHGLSQERPATAKTTRPHMIHADYSSPEYQCPPFYWARLPDFVQSMPSRAAAELVSMKICTTARRACAANAPWARHSNPVYSNTECRSSSANGPSVRRLSLIGDAAIDDCNLQKEEKNERKLEIDRGLTKEMKQKYIENCLLLLTRYHCEHMSPIRVYASQWTTLNY